MDNIIIVGSVHINTYGVIRALGEENYKITVALVGYKKNFICFSKYVRNYKVFEKYDNNLRKFIISELSDRRKIIIPTSDQAVEFIESNLNYYKDLYFSNLLIEDFSFKELMKKNLMFEIAKNSGLKVPKFKYIDLSQNLDLNFNELKYPLILKPLDSISGEKDDIQKIESKENFEYVIEKLKNKYDSVLIQEYMDSEESKMLEIIGYVSRKGEVIIPGVLEKIRHFPTKDSSGSLFVTKTDIAKLPLVEFSNFIKQIGFRGIFDLEFKVVNGEFWFIEINFRIGGTNYLYKKAGASLPKLMINDFMDKLSLEEICFKNNIIGMYEERDWRNILLGKISLFKWLKDLSRTNAFTTFNLKDIMPFFVRIYNKMILGKK